MKSSKVSDWSEFTVLLLEDDDHDACSFKKILAATALPAANTIRVCSLKDALSCLAANKVDLIVVDLFVDNSAGLENFHSLQNAVKGIPIIVLSTKENKKLATQAFETGAHDYLIKGSYDEDLLEKSIRFAIERNQILTVVERSRRQYELLFEKNPMPSWAFDPVTFQIKMVNAAAVDQYGFTRDEFLAMDVRQLRPENEVAAFESFASQHHTAESVSTRGLPFRHRKKDGTLIDVEVSAETIHGDDGDLVLVVVNDVTEQKKAARLLAESEQRLDLAITAGRMVMMDYNYRTRELQLSRHGKNIIGLDGEIRKPIEEAFSLAHPDDLVKVHEALRLGESGKRSDFQFRVRRPDNGKTVWVESRSNILFDSQGVPEYNRGVLVDVTAFQEAQDYLLESLKRLEEAGAQQAAILNSVPAHIALIDNDGVIISVNDAWKKFARENGLGDDTYGIGKSYYSNAAHDPEAEVVYGRIKALLAGTINAFDLEYACHSPEHKRWFKAIASPLMANERRGAVIMHIDITDRKLIEEDLRRSRADLVAIFDNTEDGYTLIDSKLEIIAFNKRANRNAVEVLNTPYRKGRFFGDYLPARRRKIFQDYIAQASSGRTVQYDVEYDSAAHGKRWFQLRIIPVVNEDNASMQYILCTREFTNEKRAEIALKQREERFRAFIENSGDMFTITKVENSTITYASPNIQKHLCYDSVFILGHRFADLVHPDDAESYHSIFENASAAEGMLFEFKVRIRDWRGSWLWVEGTMSNLSHIPSVNGLLSNFRDITEKVKTEEELKHNRYILEKANKAGKIGHWVSQLTGDCQLQWSPQIFEMFGIDEGRFEKNLSSFLAIVHPDDIARVKKARALAIEGKKSYKLDHRVIRPDGRVIWVNQQAEVFYDDMGTPASMIGVSRDITERKSNEEQIRKSKNNLDALINNTQDLLWSCDKDLRLVSANTAFVHGVRQHYGLSILEGDSIMVMPRDTDEYRFWAQRYNEVLNGKKVEFETSVPNPAGDAYHLEVTLNPIMDGGEVIGLSGFLRDSTQKKKNENILRSINERFELLSRATNDAVWDWDINNLTLQWNHGLNSIFGYEPEERKTTIGWWMAHVHPDDFGWVDKSLLAVFEKKETNWQGNYRFQRSDGSYVYIHDRGYVIYEHDKPVRMIGAMQDVHELTEYRISLEEKVKEHTRDLHQALEKEKELSEMKSRFVSIASHEFRTPLSSIQFAADYLQMYRHKITESDVEKKLESITVQVAHMMYLLDDVLTIGKSESGKIAVNKGPVNLQLFFRDLVENLRHATKSTHDIVVADNLQDKICETDEKLLFNIFSNLLSNAIKFSPGKDKVFLTYGKENGKMIFEVADNGIGIDASERCSVFEPFTRGSNAGAISGTGLGLAIVKTAVELLEGKIKSFSNGQFKTVFRVELPCGD